MAGRDDDLPFRVELWDDQSQSSPLARAPLGTAPLEHLSQSTTGPLHESLDVKPATRPS